MLLSVHAIEGSASAPTAQHQRRRPRLAGDRAGKQNRQFIGALIERFRHFSDLLLHLVALHGRKIKPKPRPYHCPRETIDVKGKGPMRPYLLLGRRRDHQTSAVGELHERPAHSRTASAANERSSPATGIEGLGASVD